MSRELQEPLLERVVLVGGVLLVLLTLIAAQYSARVRYQLFGTGEEDLLSQPVGTVSELSGRCERQPREAFAFEPIQTGQPLYVEDTIISARDSRCVLALVGDRSVELGPESLVRISKALVLPGMDASAVLSLQKNAVIRKSDAREAEALKAVMASAPRVQRTETSLAVPALISRAKPLVNRVVPKAAPPNAPVLVDPKSGIRPAFTKPTFNPAAVPEIVGKNAVPSPVAIPSPTLAAETSPSPVPVRAPWKIELTSHPVAKKDSKPTIEARWVAPKEATGTPHQLELLLDGKVVTTESESLKTRKKHEFSVPSPGSYRVRLLDSEGKTLAEQRVSMPREIQGLKLEAIRKGKPAPTLNWEKLAGARSYRVVIEDGNSGAKIHEKTGLKATSYMFNQIQPTKTYRYRVIADTASGFQVASATAPLEYDFAPAEIRWPAHDDKIKLVKGKRQLISWNKTDRTQSYMLEISTDEDFKTIIFEKAAVLNFAELLVFRKGTYYARVRCFTDYGKDYVGPTRRFSIDVVD